MSTKYALYWGHTLIHADLSYGDAQDKMAEFLNDNYDTGSIVFDRNSSSSSEKCWNITNRGILSDDYFVIKESN
jgi:hypothetical protein